MEKTRWMAFAMIFLLVFSLVPALTLAESGPGRDGDGRDDDDFDDSSDDDKTVEEERYRDGDTRYRYKRVTDEDGNTRVRRERQTRDDEGNVLTTRARVRMDADGRVEGRQRQVLRDENGTVLMARGRTGAKVDGEWEVKQRKRWRDEAPGEEARERVRDRMKNARESYQEIRERYEAGREEFRSRSKAVQNAKADIAACRGDSSEECENTRIHYRENAARFLMSTAESLLNQIVKLETYIESRVNDEAKVEDLLNKLAEIGADVDEAILAIEALPEQPTAEELKPIYQSLKQSFQDTKRMTKYVGHNVVHHKIRGAGVRLQRLEERFYDQRDRLEEAGADVAELDVLLGDFSDALDASVEAHEAAGEVCEDAREDDTLREECKDLLEESREAFKEAVKLVKPVMHELRDLRQEIGDGADYLGPPDEEDDMDDSDDASDDESDDSSDDSSDDMDDSEDDMDDSDDESDDSSDDGSEDDSDVGAEVNVSANVNVGV